MYTDQVIKLVIASGGGGGGSGIIAAAAANLSAGSAIQVTLPQIWNINQSTNQNISCYEYCTRICWDASNKKMRWWGCSHDNSIPTYFDYSISTDVAYQETFDDGEGPPTNARHSYDGYDCDTSGNLVGADGNLQASYNLRNVSSNVWSKFTNPVTNSGQWHQVVFHPNRGTFIDFNTWGIYEFTFSTGSSSFNPLRNGFTFNDTDDMGSATFNPRDNCAYGGFGTIVCKVFANGTVANVSTAPASIGYGISGSQWSIYGASIPTNKLRLMNFTGDYYQYDDVANTWGSLITANGTVRTYLGGAGTNEWIAGRLPDVGGTGKGVMIYSRQISAGNGASIMDANVILEAY